MSRPIIAVDVDDVLAQEREGIRLYINETYGLSLSAEDYSVDGPYWEYWESVWKIDDEEAKKWYAAYLESGAKAFHKTVEGAAETIALLRKDFELVIVTSRDDKVITITHDWLTQHFPDVFNRVEFVTLWSKDKRASKAAICQDIGASYLIDDSIDHCNTAAEVGVKALLFGYYGWNRKGDLHPEVTRVADWSAVEEYFNGRR